MIEGHLLHEDHLGNRGELRSGGVQWMTAGRGIIHSEMPQQEEGLMRGFQLWLNLPARDKMTAPGYRDLQPEDIPVIPLDGGRVRLIAGTLALAGQTHRGPIQRPGTEPLYADLDLHPGGQMNLPVPAGHSAFLYLYEGQAHLAGTPLARHAASVLGHRRPCQRDSRRRGRPGAAGGRPAAGGAGGAVRSVCDEHRGGDPAGPARLPRRHPGPLAQA